MNVRSLPRSSEGGGTLLPFRGHRDTGDEGARDGGDPRGPAASRRATEPTSTDPTSTDPTSRDPASTGSRVVPLMSRRATTPNDSVRRDWARAAVLAATAAVVLGGAVAATLTGVVPLVTERPAPRPAVSAPPTVAGAEGPNVPAAYGLCKAFDRAAERGHDVATALAFRNLAQAAGGASKVSAYCAPFDVIERGRAR